ncbi:hypothetical protein MTR67_041896 [Solanum verrucosum]|uniref:Uncharacterized protein n=1 Tax=Solanum verrucosum TaxID=315347 RepID=A0AAF0ZR74_SOLVR|nr:hypothetical protein MTR67_041896 [Solanum verrucosum]
MKPLLGNLEKELSTLISILEKELSSLSSIVRDVAKVHHEHKIPKDLQRRTINLAYEAEVAIDSILSLYNVIWHILGSLPTILKEIEQINAKVTEMWSADITLNPCYVVAPFKHLPTRHSNPVTDEEIVGFGNDTEKMIQYLIRVLHFCSEKSREEKFMLAVKGNLSQFLPCDWKESRVSFILSKENSKFASLGFKTQKPFHQPLRSLMTIGKSSDEIPLISSWIHKLQLLKVLDLSSHVVDYFSSASLKPLNLLKYLAVWAATFYFHPESDLPHLETLIVNTWRKIVLLPASFREMGKLRHVEIDIAKFDKQGLFEGSSKLENLRILKKIVGLPIDDVDVLSRRCPNLQQLDLYFSINEAAFPVSGPTLYLGYNCLQI